MSALLAALGCSLMMVLALAAFAWYAFSARKSNNDEANEMAALRAEIAELRRREQDASGDQLAERG